MYVTAWIQQPRITPNRTNPSPACFQNNLRFELLLWFSGGRRLMPFSIPSTCNSVEFQGQFPDRTACFQVSSSGDFFPIALFFVVRIRIESQLSTHNALHHCYWLVRRRDRTKMSEPSSSPTPRSNASLPAMVPHDRQWHVENSGREGES